jgi:asparagine synthase (glutamine-hydrolysing)
MCGINGFLVLNKSIIIDSVKCIKSMNDEIIHRGPDDAGYFINGLNNVVFGMQRLSIIDLNSGMQPMISENGKIVVVFNGEIYNFKELRKYLILNFSVKFKTNSDTEVILIGYEILGKDFFQKLNGMFSIAIYDELDGKIILIRDRTGEKPLYYWSNDNYFVFCSELKSLKKFWALNSIVKPNISVEALNVYLSLTYIPAPLTIFEGVLKLEPGFYLEKDIRSNDHSLTQYWNILPHDNFLIDDYSQAKKQLKDLVYDSVEKRMVSDVSYGAFLSGGVDSSIIVAVMSDLKPDKSVDTFSIVSNNKKFDESDRSNSVSIHCNTSHHPIFLDAEDIKHNINSIILNYDEPFADSSALPTYFVSKMTKKNVTVALTGDGGDEVFGGYNRYKMSDYTNLYRKFIPNSINNGLIKPLLNKIHLKSDNRGNLFKIKKFINATSNFEIDNFANIMSLGFENNTLIKYLNNGWHAENSRAIFLKHYNDSEGLTSLQKARYLDFKICLEGDMLTKVDRASMINSIECRPPFLDHRLIEFSYQLPDNFLIKNGKTKRILKETFEDMLPKGLFSFPKSGFGIPIGDWMRNELKSDLIFLIDKEFLIKQGIFCAESIRNLVFNHINGFSDNTFKVWTYFCFQKWYINEYNSQ